VGVRVELIQRLAASGIRRIEVGSFVSERAVPQMARSAEVVEEVLGSAPHIEALVVNRPGADAAVASGCTGFVWVVAATDSFSLRNVRATREDVLRGAEEIVDSARAGSATPIANIAVSFGCPDDGLVRPEDVADLAARLVRAGFEQVFLSDTIGVAGPRDVTAVVRAVGSVVPMDAIGLHLHDTRGLGLVNAIAGLEAGIRRFDASIGGIGGCPFAPGASGNVATEDLAHLLLHLGMETSIALDDVAATARWLGEALDAELPGHFARARGWVGAA
jgi:hydroxymethylglutaryl-CoA lyase